jgi:hypothetical protein
VSASWLYTTSTTLTRITSGGPPAIPGATG